ncbi:MAG: hypothetical protein EPN91_04500 [Salinibacterium sp.]|nr:MAG: hypothetical protein EPN91_04500 [Salinibacterium sp.]
MKPSGGIAALSILICAASLCGCSASVAGPTVAQARERFYSVLDETQAAVGGVWENRDDSLARSCVIPNQSDGKQYPGLRIGSAPSDPEKSVQRVVNAWVHLGYSVKRTMIGDIAELQGRNAQDELLIFRVSDAAMTLQGESECRPAS